MVIFLLKFESDKSSNFYYNLFQTEARTWCLTWWGAVQIWIWMGLNNLSQDWSLNCRRTKSSQKASLCSVPAVLDYDTSSCVPKIHHKQEYSGDRFQLVTEIRRAPKIKPHQAIVLSFMFFVTILKAFASLGILNMFILGKSMKLESDCCCSALLPLLAQFWESIGSFEHPHDYTIS